ncbi:hypothetical protein J4558_10260 [Leptolyngbya sp. 15MV]|nr:hypothetical protein J4558_10260 [Leptolyngbya sp. 15MV]
MVEHQLDPPAAESRDQPNAGSIAALLAGLESHETSIESVSAVSEEFIFGRWNGVVDDLQWSRLTTGSRYNDRSLKWTRDWTFDGNERDSSGQLALHYEVSILAGDGVARVGWMAGQELGMVAGSDATLSTPQPHLWRVLGRHVDPRFPAESPLLHEILRSARELEYLPPTEELPWPGVLGRVVIWETFDLEVRIDPQHGFVPRHWKIDYRRTPGVKIEMIVSSVQRVGEFWMPRVAIFIVHFAYDANPHAAEPAPVVNQILDRYRSLVGLPPMPDPQFFARHIERSVRITRDPSGTGWRSPIPPDGPHKEIGLTLPSVTLFRAIRINDDAAFGMALDQIDDEHPFFIAQTRERTSAARAKQFFETIARAQIRSAGQPRPASTAQGDSP